jgi:GT2 family glycosyltransferase
MNKPKVWLAYVSCPITTAVYLERALRRISRLTTLGPVLPEELIEKKQLQNIKASVVGHDVLTNFTPEMGSILAATDPNDHPDLYLWVESVADHFPVNLQAISCPKACYLLTSGVNLAWHLEWARQFDHVFIAQREYLENFRAQGLNVHWLPPACDPEIHGSHNLLKQYDVGFVGSMPGSNPRRGELLKMLAEQTNLHAERCFLDDMAKVFSASRIVFNCNANNDLNTRVFEAMSTGSLLLTDMAWDSGQDILFRDSEDYALFRHDDLLPDTVGFYLDNEELRERIGTRGRRLVHAAHTYHHRAEDLINVALGGKATTFSAEQLRQRSLEGLTAPVVEARDALPALSGSSRSFVIPVLDYSPASTYSIVTLLDDLADIEGDVIVVFNSETVADELKNHPRITQYAVMKRNVGVSRAWNIGLDMAVTPVVFIVNADVHLQAETVAALETFLMTLDKAACTGPQGSFVDFSLTRDYCYFDKGSFPEPLAVDAVSGFLFALKREHFTDKLIRFEDAYTPCYFEEWDLGLQIKKAGLKSYIIPVTAYDHHWSGTIRALREIEYYSNADTAGDILKRNRGYFLAKWRSIAQQESLPALLQSGFREYGIGFVRKLLVGGKISDADQVLGRIEKDFPRDGEIQALRGYVAFHQNRVREASLFYRNAGRFDPEFDAESYTLALRQELEVTA